MSSVLPDPTTPFGQRVAKRLRDDKRIWITSVSADGTPQPNPVWYLWDGESFLIYTLANAARLAHIARNPHVALNFETADDGNDVIVFTGEARLAPDAPPADKHPAYMAKYQDAMTRVSKSVERFASIYSVALLVTPKKVRGL
ncbi:MAG: TIGR03667 family PPOX class F420-dependent oxidoreductase [Ktedonobacterales bacterium]